MAHTGSWGLPDFGVTEWLGGLFGSSRNQQGGSDLWSSQNYSAFGGNPLQKNQPPSANYTPGGSVLGSNTGGGGSAGGGGSNNTGGGGGGGGFDQEALGEMYGQDWEKEQERMRQEQERVLNEAYAPAFEAYNQLSSYLEGQLPGTLESIGQEGEIQKSGLKTEEASRLAQYNTNRETEKATVAGEIGKADVAQKNAIAEARRQQSQLMQGLFSKYGTTTGTAGFAGEIAGAQTMKNIGGQRQVFQQFVSGAQNALKTTLQKIADAEDNLKNDVLQKTTEIDFNVSKLKQQARDTLNQALMSVNAQRGELEINKANKRMEILSQYQNNVNQIKQWAAEWQKQVELNNQELGNQLALLKAKSVEKYQSGIDSAQMKLKEFGNLAGQAGLSLNSATYNPATGNQSWAWRLPSEQKDEIDQNPYL